MNEVPENIQRAGGEAVRMYARLLSEGYGHKWAEMCSLQQPPGTSGTDRALMQNRYADQWLDALPKDHADKITREARAAGINISGKYYYSGLADKRGHLDPAAWLDNAGDIKKVAKAKNLTVHGAVQHEATPVPRPKSKPLSERLIREFSRTEAKMNPGKKPGEIREIVLDKYTPSWKKGK
jgi:hypothetical protein